MANGVALSPDGKQLWATEFARNLLHRIELADATTITPLGSAIAYRFTGPAPDSMRADADGNLYVAIYGQGRVLAFNPNGIPIGQLLLPNREQGHNLQSTSMAIRPGTNDLYIVANDGERTRRRDLSRQGVWAGNSALLGSRRPTPTVVDLQPRREDRQPTPTTHHGGRGSAIGAGNCAD
jgi:sugar lactone lactonase YvrE